MLPDYTETKALFGHFFQTYSRKRMREISPLSAARVHYLHEGRRMATERADSSSSNSEVQSLSSVLEIRFDEIPGLTLEAAIAKFDAMILDMVRQQTGLALERLDAEIPEEQKVDAKGKKLDAEMILQMYEAIQLEFYPDGKPHELQFVGSLFTQERLQAIDEQFRNDPELSKRYEQLIDKKREEWSAREASRKLVG